MLGISTNEMKIDNTHLPKQDVLEDIYSIEIINKSHQ